MLRRMQISFTSREKPEITHGREFLFQKWNRQIHRPYRKQVFIFTESRKSNFVIKVGYSVQDVESLITAFLLLTTVRTSNCFARWLLWIVWSFPVHFLYISLQWLGCLAIKYPKEIWREAVDSIALAKLMNQWRPLVGRIMKLCARRFLTKWATIRFSSKSWICKGNSHQWTGKTYFFFVVRHVHQHF